jgi:hypothetical protein
VEVNVVDGQLTEDRVVKLRSQGRSYGAVAKMLGLRDALDAYGVFCRAGRRRPPVERDLLRDQELEQLDTRTDRLRARGYLSKEQLEARLRALVRLRQMVLAP